MLKKVFKAVAELKARANKRGVAELDAGSSLYKKIRRTIDDLEGRAKEHDLAAGTAREAAQQLRKLLAVGAPTTKAITVPPLKKTTPVAKAKPAAPPSMKNPAPQAKPVKKAVPAKKASAPPKAIPIATPKASPSVPAKSTTKSNARPTLAEAVQHVLKTRRDANAGGVNARQLYAEVQQAGYQFGGNNVENRMNYLHKTLRQNSTRFKRTADGSVTLV